jgi:hypothetical protein
MTRRTRPLSAPQVQLLTTPAEPWLSCEGCFDLMDVVVERLVSARDEPDGGELVSLRAHLRACPACAEEVAALLELVCDDDGADSSRARAALGLDDADAPH